MYGGTLSNLDHTRPRKNEVKKVGDKIGGELGDAAGRAAIGKDIQQDNREYRSPVTVNNQFGHDDHVPPIQPQPHHSERDRLLDIERYMYGDGYTSTGLLRQMAEIIKQQGDMIKQFHSMMVWLYLLTAMLAMLVIFAVINLIVLRMPL